VIEILAILVYLEMWGKCDNHAVMKAVQTAKCPIDVEDLKKKIEAKMKKEVILGTHPY